MVQQAGWQEVVGCQLVLLPQGCYRAAATRSLPHSKDCWGALQFEAPTGSHRGSQARHQKARQGTVQQQQAQQGMPVVQQQQWQWLTHCRAAYLVLR